jgi:hypothetical protein
MITNEDIVKDKFPHKLVYVLITKSGSISLHEDMEVALLWATQEAGGSIEVHALEKYGFMGRMEVEV